MTSRMKPIGMTAALSAAIPKTAPILGRKQKNLPFINNTSSKSFILDNKYIDKWYIKDLIILGVAKSMYELSKKGNDWGGELRAVHQNKSRKERKKINTILKSFSELNERLFLKLSSNQATTYGKIKMKIMKDYFFQLEQLDKPNLELVAAYLLYLRFIDLSRVKINKPHSDFEVCKDRESIFTIVDLVEKTKIKDEGQEYNFASTLINTINKA